MAETILNQEEQTLDTAIDNKKKQSSNLKKIIGIVLSVIMVGLTIYVLVMQNQNYRTLSSSGQMAEAIAAGQAANYRAYVQQYKETKIQLDETTLKLEAVKNELDQVSAELATTKGMLSDTQGMLAQAQNENAKLKEEIQGLDELRNSENVANIPELEAKIKVLREKNIQVDSELVGLKKELRVFEADFATMDEGKNLLSLFKSKLNLVKSRMRFLKQEAYFAKVAAQKERDRIETINGNSGFLMRDGQAKQPTKPAGEKGYAVDVKIVQ